MITRIETNIVYQGVCENGVVIIGPTFKGVYRECVREMRSEYGHSLYFEIGRCEFSYGVQITIHDDSLDYPQRRFESIRDIGELSVFSIDRKTNVMFRKGRG